MLTSATVKLVQINPDKELFIKEMLKIDQDFFEKIYLTTTNIHTRIGMQKQIFRYLKSKKTRDGFELDEMQIRYALNNGTSYLFEALTRQT